MVAPLWGPAYPTGSGIYAYELARRLAEAGNHVDVYTSTVGNGNGHKYPENMTVTRLRTYGLAWGMNPIANIFPRVLKERYDIVHVHSYLFFMSNMAAMARMFNRFGYVLNIHGGLDHSNMGHQCGVKMMAKDLVYDRTLGHMTVKLADKVISISKKDMDLIRSKFDVEPVYIPNAVSTDQFSYLNNDSRTVTYVGKLEPWKGVDDLLEIFQIVKKEVGDARFTIAGEGSLYHKLKKQNFKIDMIGHVPHAMMPSLYHNSAVTVLPSLMEGAPTTCIESLACGVPCVATDVGDTGDIVKNGESGFLVKPGSVDEAAEHIVKLLVDNRMRRRMGRTGRDHVIRNFSYESVGNRMMDIYRSIA